MTDVNSFAVGKLQIKDNSDGTQENISTPVDNMEETFTPSDSDTQDSILLPPKEFNSEDDVLLDIPEGEIDQYLDHLAKFGITKEQIFKVLDTLLTKGDVLWSFKLFKRIPCVFRIRPVWVNELVFKRLEESPPKTMVAFNDIVGKYNLAGSLLQYGSHKFAPKTEDEVLKSLDFIRELPFIIKSNLIKQLVIFDRVIAVATSSWAIENFTLPPSGK